MASSVETLSLAFPFFRFTATSSTSIDLLSLSLYHKDEGVKYLIIGRPSSNYLLFFICEKTKKQLFSIKQLFQLPLSVSLCTCECRSSCYTGGFRYRDGFVHKCLDPPWSSPSPPDERPRYLSESVIACPLPLLCMYVTSRPG